MWKRLLAPGAIIAGILGAYFGGFPGEPIVIEVLHRLFDWLIGPAAHPKIFVALSFLFIGFVVIPNLIRLFSWRGDWEIFRQRQQEVYREAKADFHSFANQAYGQWIKNKNGDYPSKLDDLINSSLVPNKTYLMSNKLEKVVQALEKANPKLWKFCTDFYDQIENVRSDELYQPSLLTRDKCENFSNRRRRLTQFWDLEGEKILSGVGIIFKYVWLQKLNRRLQDSSIRLLPYLETALAKRLGTKSPAAVHLFRLSTIGWKRWHAENISVSKRRDG